MIELFKIYSLSLITVPFASCFISTIGHHLVLRREILKFFVYSQFFLLGNLTAHLLGFHHYGTLLTLSLLAMLLGSILTEKLVQEHSAQGMIAFYLVLQSLQFMLISYFPALDSHLSTGLFGSIVTAQKNELYFFLFIVTCAASFYFLRKNHFHQHTIQKSVFRENSFYLKDYLLILAITSLSLYTLGFLFTMSIMLLPAILMIKTEKSYQSFSIKSSFAVFLSSLLGLSLSLVFDRISTVPCQVILLFLFLILFRRNQKT